MNDNEQLIDQSQLAEDVAKKIRYEFKDKFLVKPLDPVMVKKEFTKLPENKQAVTDENDIEAVDIAEDDVKTEIKEVEADYRKGVVITLPLYYDDPNFNGIKLNVGDIVLFKDTVGLRFDLLKDSRLLRMYDLVGAEK
jgi:hypothetical protein